MAKKKDEEGLVDVGQVYSKSEDFVNNNGKTITMIVLAALILVAGFFIYKKFIVEPQNKDAQAKIWKAEYFFAIDSLNLALNGNDEYYGFAEIAEEYSSTASGNLAQYYSGVISLKQGDFVDAIDYLSNCSFSDNIVLESTRLGCLGDAQVESGNIAAGIDSFKNSISTAENTATTPIYLKKLGLAYEAEGNTSAALETYERLKRDFNNSAEARTIDKYIGKLSSAN
ncbi:MAG: tetratricopeptide (TPR) repeat protein [Patiriisocius sp.]|jgi:tetratricopeptide (TPR) repeat protein